MFQGLSGLHYPDDTRNSSTPCCFCHAMADCWPNVTSCCPTPTGYCCTRGSAWHGNDCHPCHGSVSHGSSVCYAPSTHRIFLSTGRVFTPLGDVPLPLPPFCTTSPTGSSAWECAANSHSAVTPCLGVPTHSIDGGSSNISDDYGNSRLTYAIRGPSPLSPSEASFSMSLTNPASPSGTSYLTADSQGTICAITPTPKADGGR